VHARRITGPQDFARHPGEEFVYVLSGAIEVHFEDGQCLPLSRGDSLYFDSRLGHAYTSVSQQLAKVIGVVTDESGLMREARGGVRVGLAGLRGQMPIRSIRRTLCVVWCLGLGKIGENQA